MQPREALLRATLDDGNGATEYHFVYGLSSSYGSRTPAAEVQLPASTETLGAQLSLTGLQPASTYHFALVASNATGTTIGPDQTFTTAPAALPLVVTGPAIEVAQNDATLSGTVDPQGAHTGYEFDLGTDTSYGARVFGEAGAGSGPVAVSLNVQGLLAGSDLPLPSRGEKHLRHGLWRRPDIHNSSVPLFVDRGARCRVAAPGAVFAPPSINGAITIKAIKPGKEEAKEDRERRKASKAIRHHGNRRSGR